MSEYHRGGRIGDHLCIYKTKTTVRMRRDKDIALSIIIILVFFDASLCTVDVTVSPIGCAVLGDTATMKAYFNPAPNGSISLDKGVTNFGSCTNIACSSVQTRLELTAQSSSNLTLNITSVDRSDEGSWRFSTFFASIYGDGILSVTSGLAGVDESNLTYLFNESTGTYHVTQTTPCIYPNVSLFWTVDGSQNSNDTLVENKYTDNGCNGGSSLESTIIVKSCSGIYRDATVSANLKIDECSNIAASSRSKVITFPSDDAQTYTALLVVSVIVVVVIVVISIVLCCIEQKPDHLIAWCIVIGISTVLVTVSVILSIVGLVQRDCEDAKWIAGLVCLIIAFISTTVLVVLLIIVIVRPPVNR